MKVVSSERRKNLVLYLVVQRLTLSTDYLERTWVVRIRISGLDLSGCLPTGRDSESAPRTIVGPSSSIRRTNHDCMSVLATLTRKRCPEVRWCIPFKSSATYTSLHDAARLSSHPGPRLIKTVLNLKGVTLKS